MKNVVLKTAGLLGLASLLLVGCGSALQSEEEIGLRKTNLYQEESVMPIKADFTKATAPGQSKKIARAFENAPPMIPHNVDGMLPITMENNACTSCHEPMVAKSMGATPLPASHFTNYREAKPMAKAQMYLGRYNCSQCHVAQANVAPLVENNFKGEFKGSSEFTSNFAEVYDEGAYIK